MSAAVDVGHHDVAVTSRLHAGYAHPLLRQWQSEQPPITASELVFPIFVHDLENEKHEIKSLPEQYRWGVNLLEELLTPLVALGLRSILLFGVPTKPENKDATASFATSPNSPVARAITLIKKRYPSLLIMVDICLCAYTANGHCGFTKEDHTIDNQPRSGIYIARFVCRSHASG
jgi:porphobilinogen synthase